MNHSSKEFFGRRNFGALVLTVPFFLISCSSPPKPVITNLTATVSASQNSNPDSRNRPSPVVVRVYELRSTAAFNQADFFSLHDKERETLANDLVARDEFTLRPGESVPLNREIKGETKHVAVIAVFRELERSVWRASAPIAVGSNNRTTISVDGRNVTVSVAPVPNK
jgi:type VI secretion system protein VasD